MYFGSNKKMATFLLEKGEESENLRVVEEALGFDSSRGYYNPASWVFNRQIYNFLSGKYKEVQSGEQRVDSLLSQLISSY